MSLLPCVPSSVVDPELLGQVGSGYGDNQYAGVVVLAGESCSRIPILPTWRVMPDPDPTCSVKL